MLELNNQLLRETENITRKKDLIDKNKNFEIIKQVPVIEKIDIPYRKYFTNCYTCNDTCHYPCTISSNDKTNCASMKNGFC